MIGRTIAGRYKISTQLGEGGMGSVWRAQHLTLGSPVAIKLIDERIMGNTEVLARFEREAQAAANLRSPHVVQVLDYGVDDGTPFIAMELLDGESLEDRLARFGRLDTVETAMIMTHVGRAISKAHEAGITHRDLKPANIFLVRNDDEVVAKVLDFGVAKTQAPAGSATRTGHLIGTPAYMSPEQAQGNKSVDGRTDLWAMGAIAFECLLGRMVFEGDAMGDLILQICAKPLPVPSAIASVPEGFDDWFARALAREPDSRFQSAKELVDSLRQVLGVSPARSTASPTGSTLRGLGPDGDGAPPKSVRITPAGAIPVTGSDAESVASARTIAHGEPQPSLHREATAPKSSDAATQGTFTHGPDAIPTTSSPRRLGTALLGIAALAAVGIFSARRLTA
ncbi:MAG: serine/threonine protein kinase, partial [Deltaproteobacteria bacterium]|nr:serine/threonine protein kinase [Deltaproteobacteria bacterium]